MIYQANNQGHAIHVDDSAITMNLCLGEEFKGGELIVSTEHCRREENKNYECKKAFPELSEEKLDLNQKYQLINKLRLISYNSINDEKVMDLLIQDIKKKDYHSYTQKPYQAIVFRGSQPHFSFPVNKGVRIQLAIFLDTSYQFPSFPKLSKDLKTHVLTFLDEKSIIAFRSTSKEMKKLAESDVLWEKLFKQQFDHVPFVPYIQPNDFYRSDIVSDLEKALLQRKNRSWRIKYVLRRINDLKNRTFPIESMIIMKKMISIEEEVESDNQKTKSVFYSFQRESDGNFQNFCSIF